MKHLVLVVLAVITLTAPTLGQAVVPVTPSTFVRAESDLTMAAMVKNGGFGKFYVKRDVAPVDHQDMSRENRDTLYMAGVFDLDAGPLTITLPDAGKRFMSMLPVDQDNYVTPAVYTPGPHTFTRKQIGTRYLLLAVRILVDPNDPKDLAEARRLQDGTRVSQPGGPGKFEIPNWDPVSHKKIRDALLVLATTVTDTSRAIGARGEVDPVLHLIETPAGMFAANPPKDAIYLSYTPAQNDGATIHRLAVRDVPVDGFWSVSRYNEQGFFTKNAANAYTINNITGHKSADGTIVIQFGGCDGKIPNCLPIEKGWNYMVRMYRPRGAGGEVTWAGRRVGCVDAEASGGRRMAGIRTSMLLGTVFVIH